MRHVFLFLIVLFMAGCAATPMQIPPQELAGITAPTSKIAIQIYESPSLQITTVKNVAGEGLAAKLSKSDNLPLGQAIMTQYGIENASMQLARKVAQNLEANCAATVILSEATKKSPIPIEPPTYNSNADYVLEIAVIGVSASYMPLNWREYFIGMNAEARLINIKDNRIVWEGKSFANGIKDKRMKLHVTEFEKDEAKKVKEIFDIGTTTCSNSLVKDFLNKEEIKS